VRARLLLVLSAVTSLGCVHFPDAGLVVSVGAVERIQGPVVCGPLGFRKVPLQSRWGEYVRVTVTAPSKLRGTVLVHAQAEAQEPRTFETNGAATLVVDARFPNEDPDVPFALDREHPIDLTVTGLEALEGGTCEGAVFTVEHGALVPSIEERTWVAELERRGGPELIARREARARAEAHAHAEAEAQARLAAAAQARTAAQAEVQARADGKSAADMAVRVQAAASAEVELQVQADAQASAEASSEARVQASASGAAGAWATVPASMAVSSSSGGRSAGNADVASTWGEWDQPFPCSAAVEAGWVQPFGVHLEPVAVTTESRTAVGDAAGFTPIPAPPPSYAVVTAPAPSLEVEAASMLWVPAMVNLVFSTAAALSPPPPAPRQVHGARPAR
jgi:hypothetical protein